MVSCCFLFFLPLVICANVFHHASCAPFTIRPKSTYIISGERVCVCVRVLWWKRVVCEWYCVWWTAWAPMPLLLAVCSLSLHRIIHIRFDSMHQIPIAWHIRNKVSKHAKSNLFAILRFYYYKLFYNTIKSIVAMFVPTNKTERENENENWNMKHEKSTHTHTPQHREREE